MVTLWSLFTSLPTQSQETIRGDLFFRNVTDKVVIQTSPSQKLVFDESVAGTLILNGHDLFIYADNVEVVGTVKIKAFSEDDLPTNSSGLGEAGRRGGDAGLCGRNGCPGGTGDNGFPGPTGAPGKSAGDVFLSIKQVSGPGKLIFVDVGQRGGKGGAGGRGGDGGRGGTGANRTCGDIMGRGKHGPGDGGRGGTGGNGGAGGKGGPGGPGGTITYADSVIGAISEGKVQFDFSRAAGGPGGTGGAAGNAGGYGGMGHGAMCGGGGTGGPLGSPGTEGPAGPDGDPGRPGKAVCFGSRCPS
jgi:hypothetical protein